jgi:hypothetical protein
MFKDKNESLLKIVFTDKSRLQFTNTPKLSKYIGLKGVETTKLSRTVLKTLSQLEPPFTDFSDKIGYID